jgi:hypothetical protein
VAKELNLILTFSGRIINELSGGGRTSDGGVEAYDYSE